MIARHVVAECLTYAAQARTMGQPDAARTWVRRARAWRQDGARELVLNRLHEVQHPAAMFAHAVPCWPLHSKPLAKGDAAALYHAAERVWSDLLATHYGKPGSNAYDRARYRTAHDEWPAPVLAAYRVRDEARRAWELAAFGRAA